MNHAVTGTEEFPGSRTNAVGLVDGLLAAIGVGAPLVAEAVQADTVGRWVAAGVAAVAGLKLVSRLSRPEQIADTEIPPLYVLDRSGQL